MNPAFLLEHSREYFGKDSPPPKQGFELLQAAATTSEGNCVQATIVIHAVKSFDEW